MTDFIKHPASFRDPAGFVFQSNGKWYRQVNQSYASNFNKLKVSGLLESLISQNKIVPHNEIQENLSGNPDWFVTLLPRQIPFLSFPYEWPFELLKDAAILTLDIAMEAMKFGLILKDATPFNIQIISDKPILIDTLSFELYDESKPWIAYRQFIETFLCPLVLASYRGAEFIGLLMQNPNGIAINFCASQLPFSSRLNSLSALHIHLQSKVSVETSPVAKQASFSSDKLNRILTHLKSGIQNLKLKQKKSSWNKYYDCSVLKANYVEEKEKLVHSYFETVKPLTCLDIGANNGHFSRLLSEWGALTVAIDNDPLCINDMYLEARKNNNQNLLPLVIDISNPSPAIGWDNLERSAFLQRKKFHLVLALALVHHLAIGKNLPLEMIAQSFSNLGEWLIVEFVPKSDEKTKLLLSQREDIFEDYNEKAFEKSFSSFYSIKSKSKIAETDRILYLMKKD